MPKVYIINDPAPNAFATGRDPEHAVVAATTGLLEIMDDSELEGVMAHEMGHVRNYDIRVSMIVFGLVVAVGFIADMFLRMAFFGGGRNRDGNRRTGNPIVLVFGIVAADRRAAGRGGRAGGGVPSARVPRRRDERDDHAAPGGARQRPGEAGGLRPADAAPEHDHVAPVDRRPDASPAS